MVKKSILLSVLVSGLVACGGSTGGGGDAGVDGNGGCPDRDNDELCDADELTHGTNPDVADSDNDGILDGEEIEIGTNPLNPDTDGDGIPDGDELELGTDPKVPDRGCASLDLGATLSQKPVDIIVAIDNSSSMGDEINGVQNKINDDFAQILEDSMLDYRVILVSFYGDIRNRVRPTTEFCNSDTSAGGNPIDSLNPHECEVCFGPPLSSTACSTWDANSRPGNNPKFHHYSVTIDSHDSFKVLLETFATADNPGNHPGRNHGTGINENPWAVGWTPLLPNGWGSSLRKGAQRVFLEITDDESNGTDGRTAAQFKQGLADLANSPPPQLEGEAPFGTLAEPNYTFHAILGLLANTPETNPWLPTDPIIVGIDEGGAAGFQCGSMSCCPGGEHPGEQYQQVAIDTGGLRFPVCNPAGYDVIFNKIAERVVEGAEIECDFPVPPAPQGEQLDFGRIFVVYIPGDGGTNQQIRKVASAAECAAGKFYTTGGGQNTIIHLCEQTCTPIQADPMAELKVNVACTAIIE
jgi:hypothetical protein